jgi:hypothetical protein
VNQIGQVLTHLSHLSQVPGTMMTDSPAASAVSSRVGSEGGEEAYQTARMAF